MDTENIKLEYVLDDSMQTVDCEDTNVYGNVIYANDLQTIFVHNGEYYLQTNDETLLLGNEQSEVEQLVNNNEDVETKPEDRANLIQYLDEGGDGNSIVAEPSLKKIKLENKFVMLGDSADLPFDPNDHTLIEHDEQDDIASARVQYAVLKDGRLHLQVENDSIQFLDGLDENECPQEDDSNTDEKEDELKTVIDLTKVTGRNLITGHIVTLDDYLERIQSKITGTAVSHSPYADASSSKNAFINRKFTIRRTRPGKRLVGKIVDIKTSGVVNKSIDQNDDAVCSVADLDDDRDPSQIVDTSLGSNEELVEVVGDDALPRDESLEAVLSPDIAHQLIFDGSLKDEVSTHVNEGATAEALEFISKTLTGLVTMASVRKKLLDRELHIKLVEKYENEGNPDLFDKTVMYLKGFLQPEAVKDDEGEILNTFQFVLSDGDDVNRKELNSEQENGRSNSISLSIIVSRNKGRHKTTRVHFYEKMDSTSCKICNRDFKSTGHLNRHIVTSHSDKSFTCNICQTKFSNLSGLNVHRKKHEHYIVCETCGKNFATQSSLRRHMSVHDHSLRPLECTLCNARFTDESSLCKHLIIHTGIRAYQCTSCHKAFATMGDLNFHLRIHDTFKYYYCEVCGREFTRHSNLLRHAEIHRGEGFLYKCEQCGCGYKYISSLTRHVVQNHMNKPL